MDASNDPRFSAMATAPMFTKFKKDNFKTKVDSRFASVLSDERFVGQGNTDIYGRKQNKKHAKKEMEALYTEVSSEKKGKKNDIKASASSSDTKDARLEYLNKVVRGEIELNSDDDSDTGRSDSGSSAEESDSDGEQDDEMFESALAIPDVGDEEEVPDTDADVKTSNRIAIKNCDWDSVSAKDML